MNNQPNHNNGHSLLRRTYESCCSEIPLDANAMKDILRQAGHRRGSKALQRKYKFKKQ